MKIDLKPYRDIIIFVITLFGANFFWKYTVLGDEAVGPIMWFGNDITAPFDWMCTWVAQREYWWLSLIKDNVYRINTTVGFLNGTVDLSDDVRISIVWGCTAIKQSFIWLIIMLFASGSRSDEKWSMWSWRKLWFIPFGWICIYCFNILRVTLIALLIENHPQMFSFWHEYVFKYLFYGMMFMLWVWWVERIVERKTLFDVKSSDSENEKMIDNVK